MNREALEFGAAAGASCAVVLLIAAAAAGLVRAVLRRPPLPMADVYDADEDLDICRGIAALPTVDRPNREH